MISPNNVHEILGRSILADGFDIVFDFEKSQGSYLYDAKHGKKYLDLFSFFASLPLGFNHPRFKDKDYLEKLLRTSVIKPSNADIYTLEYADFVSTFHKLAIRNLFPHLFFISGGALAVENALKTAFDWKIRKNLARGLGEVGTQVIHFKQAFHGRSGYTLSLTNTFDPNKTKYFPKFNWPRITNPKCTFPLEGQHLQNTIAAEKQALEEIHKAIEQQGPDIAALIIEPIQGEGGDNHFRPEFFKALRKVCDENEILLIFDEVQTGLGLTGKWWAFENYGITPDIIAFAKKTQVGGIAVTDRIDDVDNVFKVESRINSTFGGNLADMVRCAQYCRIIEEEKLIDHARTMGEWMKRELLGLTKQHSQMTNVRGVGLMIAFDLPDTAYRNAVRDACFENGLFILACGESTIRLRPSLNISKEDLSRALDIINKNVTIKRNKENGTASKRTA